jgi:hypothetical protein
MKVGDRFTSGKGRYDNRVWQVMYIDAIDYPTSGEIVYYNCRTIDSDDWWFMPNPDEKIKSGDIKIVQYADALGDPETAAKVKGFISTVESLRPEDARRN